MSSTGAAAASLDNLDPTVLGIVVATFVFVLSLIALFVWRRRGPAGNTVLLTGLTDAGKTLLFARLTSGNFVQTYTSMEENWFGLENGLKLVDVPGVANVRAQRLRHWLTGQPLKGVVVVIDSETFPKQARDVAELLYDILVDVPGNAQLLIACNKHDLPTAKSSQVIASTLEKELSILCGTRSAKLNLTEGEQAAGKRQLPNPFKWDDLNALQVDFVECTARGDEEEGEEEPDSDGEVLDVQPVEDWINALA